MEEFYKNKWVSIKQGLENERAGREKYKQQPIEFGVKFLDDALTGIFPNDLVVITAGTGAGKTELVTSIAYHNAKNKKRIHYFALEAENGEIERRIKYKKLTEAFYSQKNWRDFKKTPSFDKWVHGKQDDLLSKFEPEIDQEMSSDLETLSIRYRDFDFTAKEFVTECAMIQDQTDLIILDHLHYLDAEENQKGEVLSDAMKKIRDTCLLTGKPVILVAHVRKQDKRFKTLIPDLEDVHGTSNVGKICTKAFSIAQVRAEDGQPSKSLFPTFFKIQKNRINGSTMNYVGKVDFNVKTNRYEAPYSLGFLNLDQDTYTELDALSYPQWAEAPSIFDRSNYHGV